MDIWWTRPTFHGKRSVDVNMDFMARACSRCEVEEINMDLLRPLDASLFFSQKKGSALDPYRWRKPKNVSFIR